jgi:hypothetical protein
MDTFAKAVITVLQLLLDFFSMEGGRDQYVRIGSELSGEKQVVPFARKDVPWLGEDHKKLVAQAERLYETDELRYKWLMSIHRLRNAGPGWILDPAGKRRPVSWGLTVRAA